MEDYLGIINDNYEKTFILFYFAISWMYMHLFSFAQGKPILVCWTNGYKEQILKLMY